VSTVSGHLRNFAPILALTAAMGDLVTVRGFGADDLNGQKEVVWANVPNPARKPVKQTLWFDFSLEKPPSFWAKVTLTPYRPFG
jgi:hypothetical protein